MSDIKYTESHEWLRLEADGSATVGVTDYAQNLLGDLVYVALPREGDSFVLGDEAATITLPPPRTSRRFRRAAWRRCSTSRP
ncbi:Glycine cleavage H-protein [Pseudogulbenkiania subflava DSM 22618]|uniref:Glycine cleavage H-protein n=1 Tax=Pseudogulbenkiania subflava DSM 22618 TaxID=1123014 RepID=A0A1Y6CKE4_9NEIS|nr:Glycine cleavage H-protein [Pseudogulbenkiania subflava DSM 22618]